MKKLLLLGFILCMTSCQDVPQRRIDSLKESIANFEKEAEVAMPAELKAVKDSFATVEKLIEAEKEKTFANYAKAKRKMGAIEEQIDSLRDVIAFKTQEYNALVNSYVQEVGILLFIWSKLYGKIETKAIAKTFKDEVQELSNYWKFVKEVNRFENPLGKSDLLKDKLRHVKELNTKIKSYLSEEEYRECVDQMNSVKATL